MMQKVTRVLKREFNWSTMHQKIYDGRQGKKPSLQSHVNNKLFFCPYRADVSQWPVSESETNLTSIVSLKIDAKFCLSSCSVQGGGGGTRAIA